MQRLFRHWDRIGERGVVREYLSGFGNDFASEAVSGALPPNNSPLESSLGLYSELISGTTFSAPRAVNRRSYVFRNRPSTVASRFEPFAHSSFLTPPLPIPPPPSPLRWKAFSESGVDGDFLDGITTLCGNGSPKLQMGCAIHFYRATRSMTDRVFANADSEMIVLPQTGALSIRTEFGVIEATPGDVVLIPRGIKFRVDITGFARGFVAENFGRPMVLPELGLIGSHGQANAIEFKAPVADYEVGGQTEYINKFAGQLWRTELDHSPFDVVAWRGNLTPTKFDMRRFVALGSATVDHPDPSIFCALTSPSDCVLGGNLDFMILPPRWVVAENTFRPPGFHRNCVAEFLSIIEGAHDSKGGDFAPGAASLHNHWVPHGPDKATVDAGRKADQAPRKLHDTLVFMFETRLPLEVSEIAMTAPERDRNYPDVWRDMEPGFVI